MKNSKLKDLTSHLGSDLPAGLVVFLVALPLCLGIALASGAPLFSGIIAGVIGGVVIGVLSGSHTSVSGPAAGLTVIVLNAIAELQVFELFLTAVFIAGIIQVILGIAKAGIIGHYFPTSVIKGMLAGIGIILIIKQIPLIFGINEINNLAAFFPFSDDWNGASALQNLMNDIKMGAVIITALSLGILLLWEKPFIRNNRLTSVVPGALIAVLLSIGINEFFRFAIPGFHLAITERVSLPEIGGFGDFLRQFSFFDPAGFLNPQVWIIAFTIAIIASLESLLSLEAADKIDPHKRVSPPNKELFAQGIGNMLNGLIGGIPVTAVIVRSSANITAGGRTKVSAIFHGFLLLASVLLIPGLLNLIPLASLAAVLLLVGYKLTKISLFKAQFKLGMDQFLPFIITIVGIVLFDLLKGIGMGMIIAIIYILLRNYKNSHFFQEQQDENTKSLQITLAEEVSFLNKGALIKTLNKIPRGTKVIIDGSNSKVIDYDVLEVIENFRVTAKERNIELGTINIETVRTESLH